ncbi:hypothetical protein QBC36DRAFT_327873 [Triangularia setosa]|uniref:Transmembrane protein n=1 Tax=Triangularia setosa TaxID=2587417 RepID=A0AAN7A966_9PEZI|nr:hypothetical protein QBC36DRAFT_327873 [Podospora setosa]
MSDAETSVLNLFLSFFSSFFFFFSFLGYLHQQHWVWLSLLRKMVVRGYLPEKTGWGRLVRCQEKLIFMMSMVLSFFPFVFWDGALFWSGLEKQQTGTGNGAATIALSLVFGGRCFNKSVVYFVFFFSVWVVFMNSDEKQTSRRNNNLAVTSSFWFGTWTICCLGLNITYQSWMQAEGSGWMASAHRDTKKWVHVK